MPSQLAPWPRLRREASHAASRHLPWRLGRTFVFMTFRNCLLPKLPFVTLKPSFGLAAPPAVPQSLRNASEIAPERSLGLPKLLFGTLKPSLERPQQSLRASAMPQRLLQSGPRRHRVPWPHSVWPSETDFWHPETLLRPRSASHTFFYDPPKLLFGTLKPS